MQFQYPEKSFKSLLNKIVTVDKYRMVLGKKAGRYKVSMRVESLTFGPFMKPVVTNALKLISKSKPLSDDEEINAYLKRLQHIENKVTHILSYPIQRTIETIIQEESTMADVSDISEAVEN